MTDEEWRAAADPGPMLAALRGRASDRKRRLFAAACCRRVWAYLPDGCREAVAVVERYADGESTDPELDSAADLAFGTAASSDGEAVWLAATRYPVSTCLDVTYAAAGREVILGWPGRNDSDDGAFTRESAETAALVREIFGHPFPPAVPRPSAWLAVAAGLVELFAGSPHRPKPTKLDGWARPVADPAWQTEAVVSLAQGAYADHAFDRLPVLADALEDAGCATADLLAHLRGPGPHARGCWALDLVLGKD